MRRHPFATLLRCLLVAACTAVAPAGARAQDGPGLVLDVQGAATLDGRGRVTILAGLAPGAEVSLAPGARVVVLDNASGRQYELTGPGAFRWTGSRIDMVRPGQLAVREPTVPAFRDVRVRTSRLAQASIAMRGNGDDGAVQLGFPVATWLTERPDAFRWTAVSNATGYRFSLTDGTGRALHEARVKINTVELPGGIALEPGRTYGWQVIADLPDGKSIEGWTEFGVASPELRARIERARPAASASFGDRVIHALLLEELGAREEARRLWAALSAERPGDTDLAERARGTFAR